MTGRWVVYKALNKPFAIINTTGTTASVIDECVDMRFPHVVALNHVSQTIYAKKRKAHIILQKAIRTDVSKAYGRVNHTQESLDYTIPSHLYITA